MPRVGVLDKLLNVFVGEGVPEDFEVQLEFFDGNELVLVPVDNFEDFLG